MEKISGFILMMLEWNGGMEQKREIKVEGFKKVGVVFVIFHGCNGH